MEKATPTREGMEDKASTNRTLWLVAAAVMLTTAILFVTGGRALMGGVFAAVAFIFLWTAFQSDAGTKRGRDG